MSEFKDKTLLITGGTGSFGHCVLDHFLASDIGEIRIFSRDEKKNSQNQFIRLLRIVINENKNLLKTGEKVEEMGL